MGYDEMFHLNGKAWRAVFAGGPASVGRLYAVDERVSTDGLHGVGDVVVEELAPLHRHVRHGGIRAHLEENERVHCTEE